MFFCAIYGKVGLMGAVNLGKRIERHLCGMMLLLITAMAAPFIGISIDHASGDWNGFWFRLSGGAMSIAAVLTLFWKQWAKSKVYSNDNSFMHESYLDLQVKLKCKFSIVSILATIFTVLGIGVGLVAG